MVIRMIPTFAAILIFIAIVMRTIINEEKFANEIYNRS